MVLFTITSIRYWDSISGLFFTLRLQYDYTLLVLPVPYAKRSGVVRTNPEIRTFTWQVPIFKLVHWVWCSGLRGSLLKEPQCGTIGKQIESTLNSEDPLVWPPAEKKVTAAFNSPDYSTVVWFPSFNHLIHFSLAPIHGNAGTELIFQPHPFLVSARVSTNSWCLGKKKGLQSSSSVCHTPWCITRQNCCNNLSQWRLSGFNGVFTSTGFVYQTRGLPSPNSMMRSLTMLTLFVKYISIWCNTHKISAMFPWMDRKWNIMYHATSSGNRDTHQ